VLFNIADHYKRKLAELGIKSKLRVVGALYGVQDQNTIKVSIASPLRLAEKEASNTIDTNMLAETLEMTTDLIKTDHPGNHQAITRLICNWLAYIKPHRFSNQLLKINSCSICLAVASKMRVCF
jgi:hypothetical protein